MKQLWNIFLFDFKLLSKYNVLGIVIALTLIYIGVFRIIPAFEGLEKVVVLLIFNDPALLGILFVGVMVLFEKNEHTLEALAVSPIKVEHYILSKALVFTLLSLLCCLAMVVFGYRGEVNLIHFVSATIFSTFTFSMLGFIAVANQSAFNQYMLRAVGIILLLAMPFLAYFDLVSKHWFWLFPSHALVWLFDRSFHASNDSLGLLMLYLLSGFWCLVTFFLAKKMIQKSLKL